MNIRNLWILTLAAGLAAVPGPARAREQPLLPTEAPDSVGSRGDAQTPPLSTRPAVAPPLGDMAVASVMLPNRRYVSIPGGEPVTLTVRDAHAGDVLMALARAGGYSFALMGGDQQGDGGANHAKVTVDLRNASLEQAVNLVLLSAGLHGRLQDNTLMVGWDMTGSHFDPPLSKVVRLNQVDASGAASFLANLGATMTVTESVTTRAVEGPAAEANSAAVSHGAQPVGNRRSVSTTAVTPQVSTFGAGLGPLRGLQGTTDERLNTITMVGPVDLVAVAESYLRQMDLRKRQVALKVQILNVDLQNDDTMDASFSSRIGDTFMIGDSGRAYLNFGKYKPGGRLGTGQFDGLGSPYPGSYPIDQDGNPLNGITTNRDASQAEDTATSIQLSNPLSTLAHQFKYPGNAFYALLEAAIVESSTQLLAEPTLLVQEGETGVIKTTTSVIIGNTTTTDASGITQTSQDRDEAGLSLDVEVSKIDDNGFVTLRLSPEVSVPEPAGLQDGIPIFNITKRSLSSGSVRLQDGQSLVLTGVIQDSDRERITKWPILGDLPLLGQLFRASGQTRQRNELVIIVTPQVIADGVATGAADGVAERDDRS